MPRRVLAFAPGRANLIGEHTDYNHGLSLPFAIEQGIEVSAERLADDALLVNSEEFGEARLELRGATQEHFGDWRDFVRGAIAELSAAGVRVPAARLAIHSTIPAGAGLASSAALEVGLCVALLALAGASDSFDAVGLAGLCSRIENDWVGSNSGLLDQLTSLLGTPGHALRIDFKTLTTSPVPLELARWRLVVVDSGEQRSLPESGYNERRRECERACGLLGIESLRDARERDLALLPEPLDRRVRHVIEENARVDEAVLALRRREPEKLGRLLAASHASLRELYEVSTDAVERTVERLRAGGAAGARIMGGGFGGSVIALFPADVHLPEGAIALFPADGARVWRLEQSQG